MARRSIAVAIKSLGEKAATPKIVGTLGKWLKQGELEVQVLAAEVIEALGKSAATPRIVRQLGILLRGDNEEVQKVELEDRWRKQCVRTAAAKAVRMISDADLRLILVAPERTTHKGKWDVRSVRELSKI